jgi:hypothetical protein
MTSLLLNRAGCILPADPSSSPDFFTSGLVSRWPITSHPRACILMLCASHVAATRFYIRRPSDAQVSAT